MSAVEFLPDGRGAKVRTMDAHTDSRIWRGAGGKATETRVRSPQSRTVLEQLQQQQTSITGIRLFLFLPAGISESSAFVGCPLCPRVCSWVGVAVVTVVPRLGLGLAWASYLGSLQIRRCPRNISVDRHARTSEGTVHRLSGCPGVLSRYSRGHGENGWAGGHSDHE